MVTANCNKDVLFWYRSLPFVKDKETADEIKRSVRRFLHRETQERCFNGDFDGVTKVYPLPEWLSTEEEANEYFKDVEYIYYRPTYFDCTGQLFTSWYKIFSKSGRFWAYHRICRDV